VRSDQTALLSVRPRFAEALLDGSKTVEIRRRRAHLAHGSTCLLYATSPVRALLGAMQVSRTASGTPDALWRRWGSQTALERDEYDAYLAGSDQACAIVVGAVTRFAFPVALAELRRRQAAFVTPQSYRFVRPDEFSALLNGQAGQLERLFAERARPATCAAAVPVVAPGDVRGHTRREHSDPRLMRSEIQRGVDRVRI
jgi:predicted transcriptional regulator